MVTVSSVNTTLIPSTTVSSGTVAPVGTKTATVTAPAISTSNSSSVRLSAAALKVSKAAAAPAPMTIAQVLAAAGNVPEGTVIKDSAANFSASINALVGAKNVASIVFTDTKQPTITVEKNFFKTDMTDPTDEDLNLVKKISSKFTLKITHVSAPYALILKAPTQNATLSLSVDDSFVNIVPDLASFQALAKAKTLTELNIAPNPSGTPKPVLTLTAAQLKSSPEFLAAVKGDYDLTITGVAAADALTVAGNADKVLKASGSLSTQAKIAISDTSANLVKSITILETVATAGRLTSITVSDGKALSLTEAQIKADSHVLATQFTTKTNIEATAVAAADVVSVQALVNANTSLVLTKESIMDTAANIQANLDRLEEAVKAANTDTGTPAVAIASIGVSDKGSIAISNTTLTSTIDALKVLTGKYTLNISDIGVSDAIALKAPSKDATLAMAVKDTASNIAANWDQLQATAKAKTLASITVTDSASSLLPMTAAQLKADGDALKLVAGDYKLSVTGVVSADIGKTLATKNIYSVEIKDTAANVLKNLSAIQTAVSAAKIQSVTLSDSTNPSLSISEVFSLISTLPNLILPQGVKFNIKDTASNVIAHMRDDIGDILKNSGVISITDKKPPNLTLVDAVTLKSIPNLAAGTKYNVTDGGAVIAAQAAIADETILSNAVSVSVNKNFNIKEAIAVTGIKTLAKGTVYSITDTADNILAQAGIAGEKILSGANTVTIVDSSTNIVAKLDQLEVLAKAGRIADIKFTDTPTNALNISQDQLVKDAEVIGKIISQRLLPALNITPPLMPEPLGPALPAMKTLGPWSPITTIGTIVDGSLQFRPYMRSDRWGIMIGDLVTPAATYNPSGPNPVSLYLMPQDGLGNVSTPIKVADFNTSLGVAGTPRNGGIYLLKSNIYAASYTPNMVDNQLALWMEQQPDKTYTMKYLPYSFSPALAASDTTVPPVTVTGTAQTLVSGIDANIVNFNWANYAASNKFIIEYETRNPIMPDQKDIFVNTFTVNGTGNNIALTTSGSIPSGGNAGARQIMGGVKADAVTAIYTSPSMSTVFARETQQGGQAGLMFSNLDPTIANFANGTDRFLGLGPSTANTKINNLEFGTVSTDPAVSTQTVAILGVATTTPAASANEKPTYQLKFFKDDANLPFTGPNAAAVATDSLTLNNPVKAIWNQGFNANDKTMFVFQEGQVVHAIVVGSDGKIVSDDQFSIPEGAVFDRYRPIGSTKSTMFEFIWREPVPGSTTGETTIKTRIYDARGTTPLTLTGGSPFNLLAGAAGNDTLIGRGNDVMAGGPGNDMLAGLMGGKDVASYLGKSTDYKITPDASDPFKVVIKDLRNGSPDGSDILTNIASVRFADKTVSLLKTTLEKNLTQSFLTISPGITFASSGSIRGYIAQTGLETGQLSVRLISGNGVDLPNNANGLIDAIVNATNEGAFKTAVKAAQTQGAATVPPFTVDIAKTLTTSVDINLDGTKETNIRVPLDLDSRSVNTAAILMPRTVAVPPQNLSVSLNQSFITVEGGTGIASGTSGANGTWINNVPFNFTGAEQYTMRLMIGTKDGTGSVPQSALQLVANVAAARNAQDFDMALHALWDASYNGNYWVGINAALANSVDINADGKGDTNVGVQLNYVSSPNSAYAAFSVVPNNYGKVLSQSFLKLSAGTAHAWGLSGSNNVNGLYTVTGQEAGSLQLNLYTNDGSPLPSNYYNLVQAISSATGPATFKAALDNFINSNPANYGYQFYYNLNGTADLLGNGTQATNIGFALNFDPSQSTSNANLMFTPV